MKQFLPIFYHYRHLPAPRNYLTVRKCVQKWQQLSELEEHAAVDLSACQVVGYGILLVGDVGNPVVGVDVVDAEEVEAVYYEPDVLEDGALLPVAVVEEPVAHADVYTLVGRCTEGAALYLA